MRPRNETRKGWLGWEQLGVLRFGKQLELNLLYIWDVPCNWVWDASTMCHSSESQTPCSPNDFVENYTNSLT